MKQIDLPATSAPAPRTAKSDATVEQGPPSSKGNAPERRGKPVAVKVAAGFDTPAPVASDAKGEMDAKDAGGAAKRQAKGGAPGAEVIGGGAAAPAAGQRDFAPEKRLPGGDTVSGGSLEGEFGADLLSIGAELLGELEVKGGGLFSEDDEKEDQSITGVGDRMLHLAMTAITNVPVVFQTAKKRMSSLTSVKPPASRSECERRCNTDGFCDPSSPLGCGGEHCGYRPGKDEF